MVKLLEIQTVNDNKDGPLEVVNYKVVDVAMDGIIALVGQRSCSIFFVTIKSFFYLFMFCCSY